MGTLGGFLRTSVGRKYLMALTGLFMALFVFAHMIGNLQIFLGPEALNRYAHFLQSNLELLWPVRIFLLICLGIHVWTGIRLWWENRQARPIPYEGNPTPPGTTFASRTMIYSGLVIGLLLLYHLLHYTFRIPAVNFEGVDFGSLKETLPWGETRRDVFRMVVFGFRQPVVVIGYLLFVGALALHLSHALSAMWQSLGFRNRIWRERLDRWAVVAAWLLFLGFAAVPIGVWLGVGSNVVK